MDNSFALRQCQPKIRRDPVSSFQLHTRHTIAPQEVNGSKLSLRSNEKLGKPIRCNFLYKNPYHSSSSMDGGVASVRNVNETDVDVDLDPDVITLTTSITSRQMIPTEDHHQEEKEEDKLEEVQQDGQQQDQQAPQPLSFVRPKPVPDSRCSGFLRVLARSLQHCSFGFAAGFGLSRQPTGWYKHCWDSPGYQTQRIYEMGCAPMTKTVTTSPINMLSSTTL